MTLQRFSISSLDVDALAVDMGANGSTVAASGATVYYRDEPYVTSTQNDGSIASGSSATLYGTQWIGVGYTPTVTPPTRATVGVQPLLSTVSVSPFPSLINSQGLARWRTSLTSALTADAPVFCIGDSHTYGEYWDGSALVTTEAGGVANGWPKKLRDLFATAYGDPGEGVWFPNDSRITDGGGIGTGITPGPAMLRNNRRFTAVTHTQTMTAPTGATRLQIVQANGTMGQDGNVPGTGSVGLGLGAVNTQITYTKNGGGSQNLTAPTNTGIPFLTEIACVAGDVFVITGPASGQNTVVAYCWRTAQTHGVVVHRIGRMGYTIGNVMGGVYSGILGTPDNTTLLTSPQMQAEMRACYKWAGASNPLVILAWGTNEDTKQLTAGLDGGVTPGLFRVALDLIVKQVTADNGCVLLVSPCPSPSETNTNGAAPLSAYAAMMYSVAQTNQHCAMLDVASATHWGGGFTGLNASGQPVEVDETTKAAAIVSAGVSLRDPNSSHPTIAGYQSDSQSYANLIYGALTS